MELKIFSVYDSKVQAYMQPFFARTTGEAIRTFSGAVSDQNTQFNKYPEDFALMEIGSYDDQTSKITGRSAPVNLGLAADYHPRNKVIPIGEK